MVKRVLITGATGGLGKAFAGECASRGWDLYLTDISEEKLSRLATGLARQYGVQVLYEPCDLLNPASRDRFWQHSRDLGLQAQMLINVAGLDFEGGFMDRSMTEIYTILRVNIEATLAMTRAMIESKKNGEALYIINVSSLAGFYPMPLKAVYAASKRFLLDFSRSLRQELRPEGIRVLALCPAGLATKADTIVSIESQGWIGQITTMQVGKVAATTVNRALAGRSVYIPGFINQFTRWISQFIPPNWVAWIIWKRWEKTRALAARQGVLNEDPLNYPILELGLADQG